MQIIDNSINESTFQVERCTSSSCTVFVVVLTVTSSSGASTGSTYTVTDMVPSAGVVYSYRVLACSAVSRLCSSSSNVLSATSAR